jgi:hypothetical protein
MQIASGSLEHTCRAMGSPCRMAGDGCRAIATRVWVFEESRLVDVDGPFTEWEAVSKRP